MGNMINENVREVWKNMTQSHTSFISKPMIPGLSITAFHHLRICLPPSRVQDVLFIAIPTVIKHRPKLDKKKL